MALYISSDDLPIVLSVVDTDDIDLTADLLSTWVSAKAVSILRAGEDRFVINFGRLPFATVERVQPEGEYDVVEVRIREWSPSV